MSKNKKQILQRILNGKEIKQILKQIEKHWDCTIEISPNDYAFIINKKDRINIVKKDVFNIDVKPYSLGIYFVNIAKDGFRLSIEGSQIVGKNAKQNVVKLNEEQARKWMLGEDIFLEEKERENIKDYVILKFNKDFIGCGKFKENYVLNYVSKARRVKMI